MRTRTVEICNTEVLKWGWIGCPCNRTSYSQEREKEKWGGHDELIFTKSRRETKAG